MSEPDQPDVRFSLRSLLIVTAAVAATVAIVCNLFPSYITWFAKTNSANQWMFAVVVGLALVPLAYFLAMRLAVRGLRRRPPQRQQGNPPDRDIPG